MKQREYRIKVHSIVRFLIAMIVIFISSIFLILDNLPQLDNEILSFIQFIAVFMISVYLAHLIGMGKAKVVFTRDGVQHIWERRFILSWERNVLIPWNFVESYVFQKDRTFDSFIINLTNKTRYKVNRLNFLPIKDDFKRLVKEFPKLSNDFKNEFDPSNSTDIKTIKKGKSIYASKSFRWIFYFILTGFVILVLTKVFNPDSGTTWSSLGVIGSAVIFYGMMIIGQKYNN